MAYRELANGTTDGNKSITYCKLCWSVRRGSEWISFGSMQDDEALERKVRSLLDSEQEAGSFLERAKKLAPGFQSVVIVVR